MRPSRNSVRVRVSIHGLVGSWFQKGIRNRGEMIPVHDLNGVGKIFFRIAAVTVAWLAKHLFPCDEKLDTTLQQSNYSR